MTGAIALYRKSPTPSPAPNGQGQGSSVLRIVQALIANQSRLMPVPERLSAKPNGRGEGAKTIRCAIYTRKSTEEGLEQEFNSLDAQAEACAAYIASQRH